MDKQSQPNSADPILLHQHLPYCNAFKATEMGGPSCVCKKLEDAKFNKPYPWKCHDCGKELIFQCKINYKAEILHNGKLETFVVPDLLVGKCLNCEAEVISASADAVITECFKKHLEKNNMEQRKKIK